MCVKVAIYERLSFSYIPPKFVTKSPSLFPSVSRNLITYPLPFCTPSSISSRIHMSLPWLTSVCFSFLLGLLLPRPPARPLPLSTTETRLELTVFRIELVHCAHTHADNKEEVHEGEGEDG